jgi:hypothetical protein
MSAARPLRWSLTAYVRIDSVGSLAIVSFLIKEGREAWQGECCADWKCLR